MRSYNARRGRLSALTLDRMAQLGPRHQIPDGPLDPVAAFGRDAPVVLEIGCGHGAAALAYAQTHPGHDVLAVDVFVPDLARMLAEAQRRSLSNLWMHQGDAVQLLEDRIAPGSLAAVHLFFPDPWPKARHSRRRFLSAHTLDLVADALRPGGHLLVATDHEVYAAHARSELGAHGRFVMTEGERPPWRPLDGFEAKGLAAGRHVTELHAEPRLSGVERVTRIELA